LRHEAQRIQQRLDTLTDREKEVMCWVVGGHLNKQIADQLGISEATVKAHRAHFMEKMQANSLADLVRLVEKVGIVPAGIPPKASLRVNMDETLHPQTV
jgi:FixJ family two-component response regulator